MRQPSLDAILNYTFLPHIWNVYPRFFQSPMVPLQESRVTRNILDCDQSNYSSRIILSHIPAKLLSRSWITRKPCCRKETARCRKYSFRLKYVNNIPYKYKTSRASKATLQSCKHAGAKHNLTRNQDSKSFKVTCLESVEKQ